MSNNIFLKEKNGILAEFVKNSQKLRYKQLVTQNQSFFMENHNINNYLTMPLPVILTFNL